ncbi:nucleolar protein 58-like [Halichondria panicea]|uniref:nucleolar protein 58-like n=1 Tax=Halichondria panicea TaxID=6063 RepID=UPI00312BADFE
MVTSENQTFFTGSQLLLLEKGGHYPVTIIPDRVTRKRKAGSAEVQPKKQDSDQELMLSDEESQRMEKEQQRDETKIQKEDEEKKQREEQKRAQKKDEKRKREEKENILQLAKKQQTNIFNGPVTVIPDRKRKVCEEAELQSKKQCSRDSTDDDSMFSEDEEWQRMDEERDEERRRKAKKRRKMKSRSRGKSRGELKRRTRNVKERKKKTSYS